MPVIAIFGSLGLVSLATATGGNAAVSASAYPVAEFVMTIDRWSAVIAATFFAAGSTIFTYLLLRGRMIPVPLAWLGVIASVILIIGLPLRLIDVIDGTAAQLMWVPMAAFEIPLGVWLIVKASLLSGLEPDLLHSPGQDVLSIEMRANRHFMLMSLVALVTACDSGKGTGPDGTIIAVRVLDDSGKPVSRMPIRVAQTESPLLDASTRSDGTASIEVMAPGVYRVYVVPRAGYLAGREPLSRTVTVAPNSTVTVDFVVQRDGVSTATPPPDSPADPPYWGR